MKLFAQVGYGCGDKAAKALELAFIDGAIFSPKDLQKESLLSKVRTINEDFPEAEVLIDPQYYASSYIDAPNASMGSLPDWNYFKGARLGALERTKEVHSVLNDCFDEICPSSVTGVIAPSIQISQSFDSREAVVAKNFLREAREIYAKRNDKRPLYASLIINREALQDQREVEYFIDDISMLDSPPDGVYLVVSGRTTEARSEIFNSDIIANWMFLNHSLSLNGLKVINGYSDLLTPFLGAVGGVAGATGWWSNLRTLSMERFLPSRSGGRMPIVRYLSIALLNRISFAEKDALSALIPGIENGLSCDDRYLSEPDRIDEAMQSWEAIRSLNELTCKADLRTSLESCLGLVTRAQETYGEIALQGIPLDSKSRDSHTSALEEGINTFIKRAEIN